MVAFFVSVFITVAMTGGALWQARRRPPGTPLTWGEAYLAGTYAFTLMFLAYGIVPHQWLAWADNELAWRRDVYFFGDDGISFFGRGRILFPQEVLRDIIAAALYGIFTVGQVVLWLWWQKRGKKARQPGTPLLSRFGRPVVKGS
ncbi:MAG: hypothetical protein ACRD0D_12345 [Acidimicrobiales bacterium]